MCGGGNGKSPAELQFQRMSSWHGILSSVYALGPPAAAIITELREAQSSFAACAVLEKFRNEIIHGRLLQEAEHPRVRKTRAGVHQNVNNAASSRSKRRRMLASGRTVEEVEAAAPLRRVPLK